MLGREWVLFFPLQLPNWGGALISQSSWCKWMMGELLELSFQLECVCWGEGGEDFVMVGPVHQAWLFLSPYAPPSC